MADQKLTQLSAASLPLDSNDLFYIVQNTTSTSSTSASIKYVDLTGQITTGGISGTFTPVNSITVVNGIVTAVS